MTEQTEETVESTESQEPVVYEVDDNGSMAHLYKDVLKPKETALADAADAVDNDGDGDEDAADADAEDEKPSGDAEPAPKGRRARQEYEKRLELERKLQQLEDQQKAQAEQTEAYKKLIEAITSGGDKPDETADKADDIDAYLKEKGFDPDNFVDDEAKKAIYLLTKENDELKNSSKSTKEQQEALQFQATVNNQYTSLPDEQKQVYNKAATVLMRETAQELAAANPNATEQQLLDAVKAEYTNALHTVYKKGVDPLQWVISTYQQRSSIYSEDSAGAKPPAASKPNIEKMSQLQKKAGAPSIDSADTGGLGSAQKKHWNSERAKKVYAELAEHSA